MIDKSSQRFIKEGLIRIYKDMPEALSYPVYYLPLNDPADPENIKQLGLTIHALHGIPHLPWPDDNCIICTEDHLTAILGKDTTLFLFIVREKEHSFLIDLDSVIDNVEHFKMYALFINPITRGMESFNQSITMSHSRIDAIVPETISAANQLIQLRNLVKTPQESEQIRQYWHSYSQYKYTSAWLAQSSKERVTREFRDIEYQSSKTPTMGLASDILASLSNIAVPCHYFVRSRFKDGFGTSSLRRVTKEKPIFSVISYNRLYRTFIEPSGDVNEITPHFRRGHIRYFWQKSGINRFALPDNPFERLKIAQIQKVERIYVTPSWVGEKFYLRNGIEHEIVTDDVPLRNR